MKNIKNVILATVFLFGISVTVDANVTTASSTVEIPLLINGDCGGCIAYADSRDDGSDRTLRNWARDLNSCRASSPECQEQGTGPVVISQ